MTTDKDTDPYEGVRAEYYGTSIKFFIDNSIVFDIEINSAVDEDDISQVGDEMVTRWNAFDTHKQAFDTLTNEISRLKKKADVFKQGLDNAHRLKCEEEERRKDDNAENFKRIEDLQSQLSKAQRDIESLKQIPSEEDMEYLLKLQQDIDEADKYIEIKAGYAQPFVNAVRELSKAQERIEELEGENLDLSKKFVQEYQITMRQQARIKELETPHFFSSEDELELVPISDFPKCSDEEAISKYRFYNMTEKYAFWFEGVATQDEVVRFNTLEEAQQAIEGNTCGVCGKHNSNIVGALEDKKWCDVCANESQQREALEMQQREWDRYQEEQEEGW